MDKLEALRKLCQSFKGNEDNLTFFKVEVFFDSLAYGDTPAMALALSKNFELDEL
ncbi:MAG: hypothetical protein JKY53_00065 [Flavobacteriales bacterium]|nr:hypothetical protein [Flavobacteriales bacterium]